MNELALSKDLNVITAEIKSYKQIAGQSVWEIGRRLNHVKENDLAHGQFVNYVERVGMNRSEAYRYMRVAKEIPNDDTWQHLGNRALYLIATLPEEERKKEHVTSKGETKTVDEMTVRELQELKRKNYQQSEEIARLKNKPPQVIEKPVTKEVVPHDYSGLKSDNQQLSRALQQAQSELERTRSRNKAIEEERNRLRSQMQDMGDKSSKYDEMNEAMKQMNGQLDAGQQKLKAQKEIYDLVKNAETLIREVAPLTYLINGEEILNNEYARKPVEKIVGDLRDMADRLESSIEKQILEGVIINE